MNIKCKLFFRHKFERLLKETRKYSYEADICSRCGLERNKEIKDIYIGFGA
jgi:hypothetical protein